jgi:hypothetical protein
VSSSVLSPVPVSSVLPASPVSLSLPSLVSVSLADVSVVGTSAPQPSVSSNTGIIMKAKFVRVMSASL